MIIQPLSQKTTQQSISYQNIGVVQPLSTSATNNPLPTKTPAQPKPMAPTNLFDNVKNTVGSIFGGISNTYSQAMQDLSHGLAAPAYAPAKEAQPENVKQLEQQYQKAKLTDPMQRYGDDVANTLMSTLQGATGGFIKNPITSISPESHIIRPIAETAGQLYTLDKLSGGIKAVIGKTPLATAFEGTKLAFIPKLIETTGAFDIYGQMDPQVKDRVKALLNDSEQGLLLTAIGAMGKARYSIPLAFGGGFGLAKLNGANNKDALVSGILFAALEGANKIPGVFSGRQTLENKEFTPEEARNKVIGSPIENTQEGKEIIKTSIQAETEGKNLKITKDGIQMVEPTVSPNVVTPLSEKPVDTAIKSEDILPGEKSASQYTSSKDFADAIYAAKPEHQIGLMDPKEITPRDPVDRTSAQYQALKADIEKNGIQEPIRIDATTQKPLTVDGSQRVSIAEDLGIKVPVIVNKGEIAGLKTIEDIYKGNVSNSQVKEQVVGVPREQLPQGEGKQKVSRLEARMKGVMDNATPEQVKELGLSTFNEMNRKETISKAAEYILKNPDDALKVLKGELASPKGIPPEAIYVGLTKVAEGDLTLATKLASLQATAIGQRLSLLAEIDPNSPVKILHDIVRVREEVIKQKTGKSLDAAVKDETGKIIAQVKRPDKYDWHSFIDSIQC